MPSLRYAGLLRVVEIAGRAGLVAGPLTGREIDPGLVRVGLVAARLLQFRDEVLRFGLFGIGVFLLAVNQRIDEDAAGSDVYYAPIVFAGKGVDIMLAQEAEVLGVVERLEVRRIALEFAYVEGDRAGVLLAAVDQELFAIALGFEGGAGQFHVERDSDGGGHRVDEEEDVAGFGVARFRRVGETTGDKIAGATVFDERFMRTRPLAVAGFVRS